jgi:cofilin
MHNNVLMCRAPDFAPIKARMAYTLNKDALRRALVGIGAEIKATDLSEIAEKVVLEKVKGFKR